VAVSANCLSFVSRREFFSIGLAAFARDERRPGRSDLETIVHEEKEMICKDERRRADEMPIQPMR